MAGQAGAVRHGVARALLDMDEALREPLRKNGLLTRDPREKGQEVQTCAARPQALPVLRALTLGR